MTKNIIFRVDFSHEIGLGHLVRCVALAEELQDNHGLSIRFIISHYIPTQLRRLGSFSYKIIPDFPGTLTDQERTRKICAADEARLIVDGYQFRSDYCSATNPILALHLEDAQPDPIRVILSKELRKRINLSQKPPSAYNNILLALGAGSDPKGLVLRCLKAIQELEADKIYVAVTSRNSHLQELTELAKQQSSKIELLVNLSQLYETMLQTRLAISTGTTAHELAALGVPTIYVITADNQRPWAKFYDEIRLSPVIDISKGVNFALNSETSCLLKEIETRRRMSKLGPKLIDGQGITRVAQQILKTL